MTFATFNKPEVQIMNNDFYTFVKMQTLVSSIPPVGTVGSCPPSPASLGEQDSPNGTVLLRPNKLEEGKKTRLTLSI